jgi:CubicO group peptidase (beta-lactamase class C family)
MNKFFCISILFLFFGWNNGNSQSLYFPPTNNNLPWDTISPITLNWCPDKIDSLYSYLSDQDTKGFIVLKDGKIVLEKYFGTFTKDSLWYWASAGKTLTSFLVGKAQEENYLSITDTTSSYLGNGWTNCPLIKERKITIQNQLTMTTGLDDLVPDDNCTIDTCLNYIADAGTRWAYHNAPYTLLEDVITNATNLSINNYTQAKLKSPTGMDGFWYTNGYNNVFASTPRSMARFGLLAQNDFIWNNDTLLNDAVYRQQMVNTSQSLNQSYGYLWWLNGKSSFMVPTIPFTFPGTICPHAPNDMFSGIGKNGQIVSISRNKGIVLVRMGNNPNTGDVSIVLVDSIWSKLTAAMCLSTDIEDVNSSTAISIYPNPANELLYIRSNENIRYSGSVSSYDGKDILNFEDATSIDISSLSKGIYFLHIQMKSESRAIRFIKQ